MTKERREELRKALAKEDLPGWKTKFILLIEADTEDDEDVGLYLEEIRALLDSDERLEKVLSGEFEVGDEVVFTRNRKAYFGKIDEVLVKDYGDWRHVMYAVLTDEAYKTGKNAGQPRRRWAYEGTIRKIKACAQTCSQEPE
jgi:hypothetical protein